MNSFTQVALANPVVEARKLLPLLAAQADEAEQSGRMTDEVFDAIKDAGLFQFMFPKRAGGFGHKLITHTETVAELAKADPGSAWAFGLLSSHVSSIYVIVLRSFLGGTHVWHVCVEQFSVMKCSIALGLEQVYGQD